VASPSIARAQAIDPLGLLLAAQPHAEYMGMPRVSDGVTVESVEATLDLRAVREAPHVAVLTIDYRLRGAGTHRVFVPSSHGEDHEVEVTFDGAPIEITCPDLHPTTPPWSDAVPPDFPRLETFHTGYFVTMPRTCVVDLALSGAPQRVRFVMRKEAQHLAMPDGIYADHRALVDLSTLRGVEGLTRVDVTVRLPEGGGVATSPEGAREGDTWRASWPAAALPPWVAVHHEEDRAGYHAGELARVLWTVLFMIGLALAAHALGAAWVRRRWSVGWFVLVSLAAALLAGVVSVGGAWLGERSYDLGVFLLTGRWRAKTLMTGFDFLCGAIYAITIAVPLFFATSWVGVLRARRKAAREKRAAATAAPIESPPAP
jgi:hypothetical protein